MSKTKIDINCSRIYDGIYNNVDTKKIVGDICKSNKNDATLTNNIAGLCKTNTSFSNLFKNNQLCVNSVNECNKKLCQNRNTMIDNNVGTLQCSLAKKIVSESINSININDICSIFNNEDFDIKDEIVDYIYENMPDANKTSIVSKDELKKVLTSCICKDVKTCDANFGKYVEKNPILQKKLKEIGFSRVDICSLINSIKNKDKLIAYLYKEIPAEYKKYIKSEKILGSMIKCMCSDGNCTTLSKNIDTNINVVRSALSSIGFSRTDICTLIKTGVFDSTKLAKFVSAKIKGMYPIYKEYIDDAMISDMISCVCPIDEKSSTTLCENIKKIINGLLSKCKITEAEFISAMRTLSKNPSSVTKIKQSLPTKYECVIDIINIDKLFETLKICYPDMKKTDTTDNTIVIIGKLNACFGKNTLESYKKYKYKSKSGKSSNSLYIVIGIILLLLFVVVGFILLKRRKHKN